MEKAGSAIVTALETAWTAIRERHPEVPAVVMITGSGAEGRGMKWGHHWRDRWTVKTDDDAPEQPEQSGRKTELFVAGERLACGARLTFQTMLHEAAHALANVRRVQDTSRQGRYHNRRFVAIAEELGLEYRHDTPHPVIGFSAVEVTEEAGAEYTDVIARLEEEIVAYLAQGGEFVDAGNGGLKFLPPAIGGTGTTVGPRKVDRNRATCGCERIIRVAPATLAEAPIVCGKCGAPFTHPGVLDLAA